MKEDKELKDLLTTGVIVEVCNEIEGEDTIKYIGVVIGNTILYDNGYDLDTHNNIITVTKVCDNCNCEINF